MRLTTKGQVTIPKAIRTALGIRPGSLIDFEDRNGEFVLVNVEKRHDGETRGQRAVRLLREFGMRERRAGRTSELTTEEIMDMTRGPMNDDRAG